MREEPMSLYRTSSVKAHSQHMIQFDFLFRGVRLYVEYELPFILRCVCDNCAASTTHTPSPAGRAIKAFCCCFLSVSFTNQKRGYDDTFWCAGMVRAH